MKDEIYPRDFSLDDLVRLPKQMQNMLLSRWSQGLWINVTDDLYLCSEFVKVIRERDKLQQCVRKAREALYGISGGEYKTAVQKALREALLALTPERKRGNEQAE